MRFEPVQLTDAERELVSRVRAFLDEALPEDRERPSLAALSATDRQFSAQLSDAGFVGLSLPERYGGRPATAVQRFLINEELYAVDAPINAHLTAERQTGPCIVHYGSDELKETFLPRFAKGELAFCIGFSEPDAGSDLAAVRTTATKVEDGWLVNGTKLWTSNAHLCDYFAVLLRTSPAEDRHQGLSQLIVDLQAPGVQINPVLLSDGSHHVNEVVMTDVFVPDEHVLGEVGMGWPQATAELSYERSNPDRYMSGYPVLRAFVDELLGANEGSTEVLQAAGSLVSRFWAIRHTSLSVARTLDAGVPPGPEVALVKDLATAWVQEMIEAARMLHGEIDPGSGSTLERHVARATMIGPVATIGGGTTEILRSVAAKGLRGVTERLADARGDLLQETVVRMFSERSTLDVVLEAERTGWASDLWDVAAEAGLPWIGVDESVGGSGGSMADALALVRWSGYFTTPIPLVETMLAGWLMERAGLPVAGGPATVAPQLAADTFRLRRIDGHVVADGKLHRVPWGHVADDVVTLADLDGVLHVVVVPRGSAVVERGQNIAYEPRDDMSFDAAPMSDARLGPAPHDVDHASLKLRGALLRATQMAGACQSAADMTIDYARERHAFGRSIASFQAVQHHMVRAAGDATIATMAAAVAGSTYPSDSSVFHVAAAKTAAGRAGRLVGALAHQVHAGIGLTQEYQLHPRTRRLWSWANEYGTELEWARTVGELVAEVDGDSLWDFVSTTPRPNAE